MELSTEDKLEYHFFPNSSGVVQFRVRAANDAHIALTSSASECDPMYEIIIGGWSNSRSAIRKNRTQSEVAQAETPGILNCGEFRDFWARWNNGTITAGNKGNSTPFLSYTDCERVPIQYVGVGTGSGAIGSWIIEQPQGGRPGGTGEAYWVAGANGSVPPGAYQGGQDKGEPMFVIRTNFEGGLIPGKLIASHGTSYVAWGGREHKCFSYEVLCNFGGSWQQCSGDAIPSNALAAGKSKEGELLYVGRVHHNGALTVGKVEPSHKRCYIPYDGHEISNNNYEILV